MERNTNDGTRDAEHPDAEHPARPATPAADDATRDTERPVSGAVHTPDQLGSEVAGVPRDGKRPRFNPFSRGRGHGTADQPAAGHPAGPRPAVGKATGQDGTAVHGSRNARRTTATERRPVRVPPGRPATVRTSHSAWANLGKLTYQRTAGTRIGMVVVAALITLTLTAVVIAPPSLSAQDILSWARLDSPDAGLGLTGAWPWVVFLALDFSAAVCVLVSLYCAMRDEPAGVFGLGVWAFAGVTAFANYQFNTAPGSPGDGHWFFPIMSVIGPILLHATMRKLRSWIREAAGATRRRRPRFAIADWFPLVGTPQATFGAWRIGGMLGVQLAADALFVYRALTRNRGWWRRWAVNGVIRTAQDQALSVVLGDVDGEDMHPQLLALLVPSLAVHGTDQARDRTASPDPFRGLEEDLARDAERTAYRRTARTAPQSGTPYGTSRELTGPATEHGTPDGDGAGTVHRGTPGRTVPRTAEYTEHGTEHGTDVDDDEFDPDLLRYADHILVLADPRYGWPTSLPSIRGAKAILDQHIRAAGGRGFNSMSTAKAVLRAMDRLAVQPGIHNDLARLKASRSGTQEGEPTP